MIKNKGAEIIGWYGMVAIIMAYALVSFRVVSGSSPTYQILNLTGALGLGYISLVKKVYQSVILQIIWSVIAIAALITILL